ncbi:MAG: sigma-70 family RNA polymerase sigma factor [Acidimicrobiales bacterium]
MILEEEAGGIDVDHQKSASTEELLQELARTGSRRIRNVLVERYTGLACHIAWRYRHRGIEYDDLRQIALTALIGALDRYDSSFGASFSSYAGRTIEGEIKRYFRDRSWVVRVPRSVKELHLEVRTMDVQLTQELGRSPSCGEIADRLHVDPSEVESARAAAIAYAPASLDAASTGGEVLSADNEDASTSTDRLFVRQLLASLPTREQEVVLLRYLTGMTQSEIGDRVGVSQMHVSRLLRKAISAMNVAACS